MDFFILVRPLLLLLLHLLLVTPAMAELALPTNTTSSLSTENLFLLTTTLNNMNTTMNILPMTNAAGLTGQTPQLQMINPTGFLFLTTENTVGNLKSNEIAFMSCEGKDYSQTLDSSKTLDLAVNYQPRAIVFYSTLSAQCAFQGGFTLAYTSLYTMIDANSSQAAVNGINMANPPNPFASIHANLTSIGNATGSTPGDSSGTSSVLGRSPTTAVAMIILYSITGIITALFLIIIVVGAVRAHRHPERYGPRRIAGRPRQSRAKGIARAMLETLPIVKFGDADEENKAASQGRDIELTGQNAESGGSADPHGVGTSGNDHAASAGGNARSDAVNTATNDERSAGPKETVESGVPTIDNGLACSVCVEDFEKGQDIRILPCKHKFHPECIDPWLLNVSGTCPLCRVDLRPTASNGGDGDGTPEELVAQPGYLDVQGSGNENQTEEGTRRHRRSRIGSILNIGRMREATPEERLEALRRLREEGYLTPEQAVDRPRQRFSRRWSRAFGSRPTSTVITSRPVSEAPEVTVDPATTAPQAHGAMATRAHDPTASNSANVHTSPTDPDSATHVEPNTVEESRGITSHSNATTTSPEDQNR